MLVCGIVLIIVIVRPYYSKMHGPKPSAKSIVKSYSKLRSPEALPGFKNRLADLRQSPRTEGNLLTNAGFETCELSGPACWVPVPSGEGGLKAKWDKEIKHSGKASVSLTQAGVWQKYIRARQTIGKINSKKLWGKIWIKGENISRYEGFRSGASVYVRYLYDDGSKGEEYLFQGLVGTFDWTQVDFYIVQAKTIKKMDFYINLDGTNAGTAWFDDLFLTQPPPVSLRFSCSYYTDEKDAVIKAVVDKLNLPENSAALKIEVFGEKAPLLEKVFVSPFSEEMKAKLNIAKLPDGRYTALVSLLDAQGNTLSYDSEVFNKYQKAAKEEIKLDDWQCLLINGRPFFPIGIYFQDANPVIALPDVAAKGFNTVTLDIFACPEHLDTAEKLGLRVIAAFDRYWSGKNSFAELTEKVKQYRNHPALLSWYLVDEPEDHKIILQKTTELSDKIREIDPYHPQYLVISRPVFLPNASGIPDIVTVDPYPVPSPVIYTGDFTAKTVAFVEDKKPVWVLCQAFGGCEHWARKPTYEELRCMTYLAVVNGAKGILFYRYFPENAKKFETDTKTLPLELRELAPVLLDPSLPINISIEPAGPIQLLMKKHNHKKYLIAVNPENKELRIKFKIPETDDSGQDIKVLFENRFIRRNGDGFSDLFTALAVHVYEVD